MTLLHDAVEELRQVLCEGGDSQAAQLELLHHIEQQLRVCAPQAIKASQLELEKQLTAALLQGPAPPLRQLLSASFCLAYGRGERQGMYTNVSLLLSWMGKKDSPAASISSKAAILVLLGELCRAQGAAMVALCHDTIALLVKSIRAPEVPLRTAACAALAAALAGSGGVAKQVQEEAIKNLKHAIGERGASAELRCACLAACPALVQHAEGLWASDIVEQIAALCTRHLDDASPPVRHVAAESLGGALVAVLAHPFAV